MRPRSGSSSSARSMAAPPTSLTFSWSARPIRRAQARAAASVASTSESPSSTARSWPGGTPTQETGGVPGAPESWPLSPSLSMALVLLAELRGAKFHLVYAADADRRAHEIPEERVGAAGPRAELRVELAGHKPGVVGKLDDLDQPAVGRL